MIGTGPSVDRHPVIQEGIYIKPLADDTYWLGKSGVGWKGLQMADTMITDESGYVVLRNNADSAYVGLKVGGIQATGDVIVGNGYGIVIGNSAQISTDTTPELQILGTGVPDSAVAIGMWSADGEGPHLHFVKSRNTTINSKTILNDNDVVGVIRGYADDGVDYTNQICEIVMEVDDASPAENAIGGAIVLKTTTTAGVLTEALRIGSSQNLLIPLDKKFQFNDSGTYIFSDDDSYLDIVADGGVRFANSILSNFRVVTENHTSADSLTTAEAGSTHTNYGASGDFALTLPSDATVGVKYKFCVAAAHQLQIKVGAASHVIIANGAVNTDDGGADGYIWADDEGESLELELIATGVWLVSYAVGTWTWVQP